MLSLGAILAIVAGTSGIVLSQVGNLIPSRKDFMAALKLRRAACIEECAASHCFLLKQFLSAGVEEFDNVMRGDGRTSRDHFWEHSKNSIDAVHKFHVLKSAECRFRIAHFSLLLSTLCLILLGLVVSISKSELPLALWIGIGLFVLELLAIFSLYALGDANED